MLKSASYYGLSHDQHDLFIARNYFISRSLHLEIYMDENVQTFNAEINPICHPLELLGAHAILHISRIRLNNKVYSPRQLYTEMTQFSKLNSVIINIPAKFERSVHLTELPRNHLLFLCDSIRPPRTACQILEEYTLPLG